MTKTLAARVQDWIAQLCLSVRSAFRRAPGKRPSRLLCALLMHAGMMGAASAQALSPVALPTGGQVAAGQASIGAVQATARNGVRLDVTQSSQQAVLNWQSFNIGSQGQVHFAQPNASATVLNRVAAGNPSEIQGQLTANGQVFLVNPSGVLFGAGAQVNTGGLTASTLDISDQNFLARDYRFALGSGAGAASVVNQGQITAAHGGYIALLAPEVRNEGVLVATQGTVALGAGDKISLQIQGDRLVNMTVDSAALDTLVDNRLAIRAAGGQVILSARAANSLLQSVVNNTGIVQATSLADLQGTIRADAGLITSTGTLDASGTGAGQSGGAIALNAGFIGLGGTVTADGQRQGGTIAATAQGTLSLAETVSARGLAGPGGAVRYSAGGQLIESSGSRTDASGATDGGTIRAVAEGGVLSSGSYRADGAQGAGGRIDISGGGVRLLSADISATGQGQGGLVRIGGAFQGGAQPDDASGAIPIDRFVTRWGATPHLVNAGKTFVNDSSRIDVSARGAQGQGGTAVIWSDSETTQLGAIDARGAGRGGAVEISSKDTLRQTALDNVQLGAGGSLLLDPKNLYIGTPVETSAWTQSALMGNGYGAANPAQGVKDGAAFGAAVALNADATTMAVGTPADMGAAGGPGDGYYSSTGRGAVRLYRFTDSNYSNAALAATVGNGYTGGSNVHMALAAGDLFGTAVALDASGTRLAVGAPGDLGSSANGISQGAAYLFTFANAALAGGAQALKVGNVATTPTTLNLAGSGVAKAGGLSDGDAFGTSVALNAAGDRLAVGAPGDLGGGLAEDGAYARGAVYLLNFTNSAFGGGAVRSILSAAPTSGKNVRVDSLGDGSMFGQSVALDGTGNLLAVGAIGDMALNLDGAQRGAVYLYSASGTATPTFEGKIGSGYTGAKNIATALDDGDAFGASVALSSSGNLLAVGATGDQGQNNSATYGAVRLYSFGVATPFESGALAGTIGKGYTGAGNFDVSRLTDAGEGFGASVAMNAAGTRLVVGTPADAGSSRAASLPQAGGGVYLFSRSGSTVTLDGVIGSGIAAVGSKSADVNAAPAAPGVDVGLQSTDNFGAAVAMNAAGTQVAVGVPGDAGFNSATAQAGAVQLFTFADGNYNGGVLKGTLGSGYSGASNLNVALAGGERFGSALALNAAGDRLAVGASGTGAVRFYGFGAGFTAPASQWSNALTGVGASSVALDGAGTRLAVGNAAGTGSVRMYDPVGATPILLRTIGSSQIPTLAGSDNFGASVALDSSGTALAVGASGTAGGSGAVHLLGFADTSYASITQQSVIGRARTATNDINLGLLDNDRFGASVAFNRSGTAQRLAVGATGTNADSGAVYLFGFPGSLLAAGELRGVVGRGYSVDASRITTAGNVNVAALRSTDAYGIGDNFGAAVAFNGTGDRLAVGASQDIGANKSPNLVPAPHYGAVYLFTAAAPTGAQPAVFEQGYTPGSTTVPVVSNTISAGAITTVLNAGVGVILKADNDITVGNAIVAASNATGALTLQAGRSLQVNASISTGNGNIDLIANDQAFSGVRDSLRDAGDATITMATGTSLNAGTGVVNFQLRDGAGLTNRTSGSIALRDVTASRITAANLGTSAASNIVLNGSLNASATSGTAITLAGKNFINNAGASALAVGAGSRWLVWSANAAATAGGSALGGLTYGFKQYNASYGSSTAADATQSGLLFTQAPTLGVTLTNAGPVTKVYDGTNVVTTPLTYTTTGLIDNDTLATPTGAVYASANAGSNQALGFSGPRVVSNGAVAVYGYQNTALGNANIGQITPKALTAQINAGSANKVYDGNNAASATLGITGGLVGTETLSASGSGTFNSQNVLEAHTVTLAATTLTNGTGLASNYTLAAGQTAAAAITPKALGAVATGTSKVYDGNDTGAASLALTSGLVAGETVTASGSGSFNSKNVLEANAITVNAVALGNGTGLASNYTLATGQTAAASITARALTAQIAAGAADKAYDGNRTASTALNITAGLVAGETVTATGAGTFNTKDVLTASAVTLSAATLADGTNGLASNYSLAAGQSAAAAITPKALTATATAPGKVYDGNASAAPVLAIASGLVAGETVTATATGSFNSQHVLDANRVTVASVALANGTGLASNYSLAAGQTATATITPKALTATATAANKVYDGNATAAPVLAIASGLVGGETVTATGTGTFNSKDVLGASQVTVNSVALADGSNGLASNYALAAGQTAAASISARALTATAAAANKVYDGNRNANASLSIGAGLVAGETVSATGTASFNSKNVLAANQVTVDTATLADGSNGLASNYRLAAGQTAAAAITPRALTAAASAANKVYDGNDSASATLAIASGLVTGETVGATGTARFNSKEVLAANQVSVDAVALVDGSNGLASNYALAAGQTAAATIAARALTATATAADKVYDGNATGAPVLAIASGLVHGETVTATGTGSINSQNVLSANTVTVNSVALADGNNGLASNYTLASGQTATAAITAKALTATATAGNKVYDGNASGTPLLAIASGLVNGETVTATGSGSFNSKDVLAANRVTVDSVTLADGNNGLASNYSLVAGQTAAAAITAKALTATATAANKVYDGNATGSPVLAIASGLINGETVTATGTGTFNSQNVLSPNQVTVNAVALADGSNGLASNYSLGAGQTVAAVITAKALTATATAANKVYDGNATGSPVLAIASGLVNGETVTATGTGSFNSQNVLAANQVTVNSVALADGSNGLASNYSLTAGQTAAASITAKALTATATAANKVYDGNATGSPVLAIASGLVNGETVTATGTGRFNSKDVLTAHQVTVDSVTLADGSNGLASNYSLVTGQTAAAAITAKALTATATAASKVYDGNAAGSPVLAIASGLVNGETVTATASGSFNSQNVLTANQVTVDSVALADGNNGLASNYSLTAGQTAAAAITAKALTATATAANKVYDGNATGSPVLAIASGLVNGENVTATGTGRFNSKDVLTANQVTVDSVTLADGSNGLASNYRLTAGQTAAAAITAKALTATATAANKVYDGNATGSPVLAIASGLVNGETVTATGTGSFNSKDVLTANRVTVDSVTLADGSNGLASNYRLDAGQGAAAAITARALDAAVVAGSADKVYDGHRATSAGLNITAGLVGGETVTATGTGTLNSKDVLTAHTVTIDSVALADGSNGLASNYRLANGQSAAAAVTAKALTATATAADKAYDGHADGAPTLTIASGLVSGETVTASGLGTFNSKNVLAAHTVTVNSVALADGNQGLASNYTLTAGQTAKAAITAKALTAEVVAGSADKVYDGNRAASAGLHITAGLVNGETLVASGAGTLNSKDVLTANTVTVNSVALTDGNNGLASNYTLAAGQTAMAAITAKALTATATATDKVYDGNVTGAPTLSIASGLVNGETVTANGTGTFNSKDVLTANTVTVNSVALSDGNNGLASNYSLASGQTAIAAITAKALTATATATDKVYDGNVTGTPTLSIASGLVNGETVTANGTGTFNSKNVLSANTVTVNSAALADGNNGLASNYSLAAGQTATAAITAKSLTATAAATDKVYDGNTNGTPTLAIASGLVDGETVTATGTGSFNSKDVLTANTVTVNSVALADGNNGLASNYSLAAGQTATAAITAKSLTATATATDKVYDGNANAAPTLTIASGLVNGENVTATGAGTFNSKDVLTANTVTVNSVALADGNNGLASNYSLAAGQTATAAITAKSLTATAAATDKVYDGNTNGTPTLAIASGLVDGETVTATGTGSFNSKDVLTANTVTVNSVDLASGNKGLASNYTLASGQTATAAITAKTLTATAAATDKVYDGNVTGSPTLAIASGLVDGETVTATGTGSFNSKDVLTASTVTVNSVALADGNNGLASNYTLASGQTAMAAITPKALTATATAADKVYDGTTGAAPVLDITAGLVGGETLATQAAGSFDSPDVLTAHTVTVNSVVLADGTGLASNYRLAAGQTARAQITPATVQAGLTGRVDKVYDASTAATLTAGNYTLSGVLGAQDVTLNHPLTGSYDSRNAGSGKQVTAAGVTLGGAGAGNYRLASTTVSANVGTITPAALVVTADNQSSANGLPLPALTGVVSGLQGADTLAQVLGGLNYTTSATATSAPGNYAITPSARLANANYTLSVNSGTFTVVRADTGGPNTGSPNTGSPNTGSPNTGSPNTGIPDTGSPNTGSPNTDGPNTGGPNIGSLNTGRPDTGSLLVATEETDPVRTHVHVQELHSPRRLDIEIAVGGVRLE